jgi:hypothetical protein
MTECAVYAFSHCNFMDIMAPQLTNRAELGAVNIRFVEAFTDLAV